MGMIKIYQGKSKPAKKKPGWQQREAEEAAWLKGLQSMTLSPKKANRPKVTKVIQVVVPNTPVVSQDRLNRPPSLGSFGGAGTKPVARPDIMYKDDPELLARELAARERKFNVAPAYNKGGDQFVTEEELENQLRGNKRRP